REAKSKRRERQREKERNRERENVFIMSRIGMTPHWGLLVSLYIQWKPQELPSVATMQSPPSYYGREIKVIVENIPSSQVQILRD
ncbi:hypothetical protein DVA76_19205, partial [Acinetobacter baumannii]